MRKMIKEHGKHCKCDLTWTTILNISFFAIFYGPDR